MKNYANLVKPIYELFANSDRIYHYQADPVAKPLIEQLYRDGEIRSRDAYIEWAGLLEHGVVAVCNFGPQDTHAWWVQIDKDGTATQM